MKKKYSSLISAIGCFFFNAILAQKITIIQEDLQSKVIDSIKFGYDDKATIGIDPQFGEVNIKAKPFTRPELRVIQRDSSDFYCLHPGTWRIEKSTVVFDSIFYSPSFDSKINYRPGDSSNKYFEIMIHNHGEDIRTYFYYDQKGSNFINKFITYFYVCPHLNPLVRVYSTQYDSSLFTLKFIDSFQVGFILVFKDSIEIPVKTTDQNRERNRVFQVTPNPFGEQLQINFEGSFQDIEIFNGEGKIFYKKQILNGFGMILLPTSNWPRGMYFCRLESKSDGKIEVMKLLKF